MKERSRALTCICVFLAVAAVFGLPLSAGDLPTFVNLGFSANSGRFLFGQYGLDMATGKPYAELYLVDTARNDFVPKGVLRRNFDTVPEAGQDTAGALYNLYDEAFPLIKAQKIDHLKVGRLLFLLDGMEASPSLNFRDFKTGTVYDVTIAKSISGKGSSYVSSFGLTIQTTDSSGTVRRVSAGNPEIRRQGVSDYTIRRIIMAPDEHTLVIIIEKSCVDKTGSSIRYMVETVKLP